HLPSPFKKTCRASRGLVRPARQAHRLRLPALLLRHAPRRLPHRVVPPDLVERPALARGELAVPDGTRHVALVGVPRAWLERELLRVLVPVAVDLLHVLGELLVKLGPDAAEPHA